MTTVLGVLFFIVPGGTVIWNILMEYPFTSLLVLFDRNSPSPPLSGSTESAPARAAADALICERCGETKLQFGLNAFSSYEMLQIPVVRELYVG